MRNQRWLVLVMILQSVCMILVAPDSDYGAKIVGFLLMLVSLLIMSTAFAHNSSRKESK